MSSDGSVRASSAAKSKQERIRDNQRRSRARRQEYLAELERRLDQCHIACREAELQRTALVDLQSENTRLRALLNFAGVSPDAVENFGRETLTQPSIYQNTSSLRHLKPKYPSADIIRNQVVHMAPCQEPSPSPSTQPSSHQGFPVAHSPPESYPVLAAQVPYNVMTVPTPLTTTTSQSTTSLHLAAYEWPHTSDGEGMTTPSDGTFTSDSFHATQNEPRFYEPFHALSPLSKAMLDRYSPNPAEMEEIMRRLSMTYGQSRLLDQGFQVHDQVLLHILNDVNAKPSEH